MQNIMGQAMAIKTMLDGKTPGAVYDWLLQNNPQFKNFIDSNKGKTVEQIAEENGIDMNVINQLIGSTTH